ncbi:response regulator transcription factor [Faecalicatena contorta]|uniref:response regulator transcription factor n=1 Tax=Faecalicatena contorta TaxID=39482 RepID=UPI00195FA4BA|nr:response regulator transcription factor [Faecalicatena contorta]MBM6684896.1 response regulator transcription factor [Faecalicatena contorta]MBM6710424.1 response regulator transcription factor [Faecalicatena contorta]
MQTAAVLLVEDDPSIVEHLTGFLAEEGFSVRSAQGQEEALDILDEKKTDLVLLDITLAQGNGFAVCARIKAQYHVPVIFLTAMDDEYSVVAGLDMGADDYISKPFRPRELVSRMRSVLRRSSRDRGAAVIGDITVDTERGLVLREGRELYLSALEYRLLLVFLSHRGQVLSRAVLMEELWDITGEYVNDNTLTVYIKRLREKIERDPGSPVILKTVRGLGYRME